MEIRPYDAYSGEEILSLYASVGWTNYTRDPERLKNAFAHSLLTLAAFEEGRLAGIIRCVGDGYSAVLIQDLLVRPDFQRQGVGRQLVTEALRRLNNVYQIQLLTDDSPAHAAFYQALGFRRAESLGCAAYMKM